MAAGSGRPSRSRSALLGTLALGALGSAATGIAAAEDPPADPVAEALARGAAHLEAREPIEALGAFIAADDLAGGGSATAVAGIADSLLATGRFEEAADLARRALTLTSEPATVARAANALGTALYQHWSLGLGDIRYETVMELYDKGRLSALPEPPGPKFLEEAEWAFRHAVAHTPTENAYPIHAKLLKVLEALGKCEDATDVVGEYLAQGGNPGLGQRYSGRPAPLPADGKPAAEGQVSRPVKIPGVGFMPQHTDVARWFGLEGLVIVKAIIDEDGKARCLRPLQGLPLGLTDAVLEAVRSWRFEPARLAGKPVRVYYTLTVNFQIQEDEL